jgi:hypothetical protein
VKAIVVLLALVLGLIPASAQAQEETNAAVVRKAAGEFFLANVCQANAAMDVVAEAKKRAGLPRRLKVGTKLPESVRKAYSRASKVYARSGMKINEYQPWPDTVSPSDISLAVRKLYRDATLAQEYADLGRVPNANWGSASPSFQRIRIALGLPPRGICP